MVLEVALNGSADCIVTHNVRDFRQAIPKSGIFSSDTRRLAGKIRR